MNENDIGDVVTEQRTRAAMLLVRYPELSSNELSELKHWFERVTSPLDFGLLASDASIEKQYRAYRADHHDRVKARDWLVGIALLALSATVIIGLVADGT
jgi:hypothetical protein